MKTSLRLLTVLAPALAGLNLSTATTRAAWPQQYGSSGHNFGYGVATDAVGNVFAGGETGDGILGQSTLGGLDGYVAKWNSSGTLAWAQLFGTTDSDLVRGLARVGTDQVAAGGSTFGNLPGFTNVGGEDAMVRLYNSAGGTVWTRQFGTTAFESVAAVAADGQGHLYVGGSTQGSLGGANAGNYDAFVSQLDITTGVVNWTRQLGTINGDFGRCLAADAAGNVYLGGKAAGTLTGQTALGGYDAFVLKLDQSGNQQWLRQFGTSSSDEALALAVDSTGAVLVAGFTPGTLPGASSQGVEDAFVLKLDPATGGTVWTRQFGTASYDLAFGVAVDANDQIIVGGYTGGVFPGETTPNANADVFVRVLRPDGTVAFTDQFGGSGNLYAQGGVAVDNAGHAYLAGHTTGTLPGQTSLGLNDAFLIQTVPEPGSAALLLGGGALLALRRRGGFTL